ncbi:MAG: hypothetical protein LPK03_00720, partial [Pontibacter sp.]|nr:hypothetical protein [Pontibacter sp.]
MKTPLLQLKAIYTFCLASAALFLSSNAFAQKLPTGEWAGGLNFGGAAVHQCIFSFGVPGNVLVSIPSTGIHDLRAESVSIVGDSLLVTFRDHM